MIRGASITRGVQSIIRGEAGRLGMEGIRIQGV